MAYHVSLVNTDKKDISSKLIMNKEKFREFLLREFNMKEELNENGVLELNNKVNMIKCQNCGASINAIDKVCKYCHTEIKYLQEWILEC